jgi:hypothetical protein
VGKLLASNPENIAALRNADGKRFCTALELHLYLSLAVDPYPQA